MENKLFRISIFFTEPVNKSLQQDEDVIRRDDQDMKDVTTKDQDDSSDKTSDEVKCLYRPPAPQLSW